MDRAAFEKIVQEVFDAVPEKWAGKLENLAVLIEDEPDTETLLENGISPGEGTLLGLYRGVPHTERGDGYGVGEVLPDTITLFRVPIMRAADADALTVREVVAETLWHEIAHYFGMEEEAVHRREVEGTNEYR